MATGEKVLEAVLKFTFDKRTAKQLESGVISVDDALESLEEQADSANQALQELTDGTEILSIAGEELASIAERIGSPLQAAAENYVEQAGRADYTSRRWLDATRDLEESQFRVGRAIATIAVPALEKAADLADKAARFAEEHPDLIRVAMGTGAVMATLGVVGTAVSRGIRLYADVRSALIATKQFMAAKMMNTAATKQLAAASRMKTGAVGTGAVASGAGAAVLLTKIAIGAGAVFLGSQIGGAIADAIGPVLFDEETWKKYRGDKGILEQSIDNLQLAAGAWWGFLGDITAGVMEFVGFKKIAKEFRATIADGLLTLVNLGNTAKDTGRDIDKLDNSLASLHLGEALDAFIQFRQEIAESEYDYDRDRRLSHEDFLRDMKQTEKDYQRDLTRTVRDYNRERLQELIEFERDVSRERQEFTREQRLEVEDFDHEQRLQQQEHNRDLLQMEKDHRESMVELQTDYYDELQDAVEERDFLMAIEAMESFEKEAEREKEQHRKALAETEEQFQYDTQREEEQFARQRKLREKEFEYQLERNREEFDYQREVRAVEFALELADMAEEHAREKRLADEQYAWELRRMQEQFDEEARRRNAAFADQIRELDASLLGERETRNRYYALMRIDLEAWLQGTHESLMAGYRGSITGTGTTLTSPGTTPYSQWTRPRRYNIIGGRQSGGYVTPGTWKMHQGEFVLNRRTTRAAEAAAGGGQLSQAGLLSSLSGHQVIELNIDAKGLSGSGRERLEEAAAEAAREVFKEVFVKVSKAKRGGL